MAKRDYLGWSYRPVWAPPTEVAVTVRRATAALCSRLGWVPLHEVGLPNRRRADILALQPSGEFAIIEVKSGQRDYRADYKWDDYQPFCHQFFFAVDGRYFPRAAATVSPEAGLIICMEQEAKIIREPPRFLMAPSRRRAMLVRFAKLAAQRLAARDPMGGTGSMEDDLF